LGSEIRAKLTLGSLVFGVVKFLSAPREARMELSFAFMELLSMQTEVRKELKEPN
jgi:hypothetical protein